MDESQQARSRSARTRLERAVHVRNELARIIHHQGEWSETAPDEKGPVTRRGTFAGLGIEASHTLTEPDEDLVEAALEQSGGEFVMFAMDEVLDVWVDGVGKVLSVREGLGGPELVGMVPGPWEAAFGLPQRGWPPSVARRLAARPLRIDALAA